MAASTSTNTSPTSVFGAGNLRDSLAQATDPGNSSFNQRATPIASFSQQPSSPSVTGNATAPFAFSFNQTQSTAEPFQFSSIRPQGPNNTASFSFNSQQSSDALGSGLEQNLNALHALNMTSAVGQQQSQPIPSFVFTPTKQKQDPNTNTASSPPAPAASMVNNGATQSKKSSTPTTPISQQPSSFHPAQAESDAPVSLADQSLLAKKVNKKLQDLPNSTVDRSDPSTPLYSLKSFEELNLHPDILKGIYQMGFRTPSRIQEITLPHLMKNPPKNIIAQSQSGTGKTAAFSLAILSRIDPNIQSVQALILAPTFELAIQIGGVIDAMAQFLPHIKTAYAIRGSYLFKPITLVRGQPLTESIVIGTPGTVEEWCFRSRVIDLSKVRMFCVDEADIMIDMQGFQQACMKFHAPLDKARCQMMLFSATYSDEVMEFARKIVPDAVVLRLKREKQTLVNIRQFYVVCHDGDQKFAAIDQIYASLTIGQAMIFCRTKATAHMLVNRMIAQQHSAQALTGALDIDQRANVIDQFRAGAFRVLVSTNVMSRGIDIDDMSLVINFDMPVNTQFEPDFETYLHRIGRCGRFGKLGYTFNLIGLEKDFEVMKSIETHFSHPIEEITLDRIAELEADAE